MSPAPPCGERVSLPIIAVPGSEDPGVNAPDELRIERLYCGEPAICPADELDHSGMWKLGRFFLRVPIEGELLPPYPVDGGVLRPYDVDGGVRPDGGVK
jgi:hypothetical protein